MNAVVDTLKGITMESKVRVGLDLATVAFMLGLSFNSGIEYNRIEQLNNSQRQDRADIDQLKRDEQPLSERVARMEAILQDIRDELRTSNEKRTP